MRSAAMTRRFYSMDNAPMPAAGETIIVVDESAAAPKGVCARALCGFDFREKRKKKQTLNERTHANAAEDELHPHNVMEYLDKHIVGQADAKRAIAIALRGRWYVCAPCRGYDDFAHA